MAKTNERERLIARYYTDLDDKNQRKPLGLRLFVTDEYYPDEANDLAERKTFSIRSRREYYEILKERPLEIQMSIPNKLSGGGEMGFDLQIKSPDDFKPDRILEQIKDPSEKNKNKNREMRQGLVLLDALRELKTQLKGNKQTAHWVRDMVRNISKQMKQETPDSTKLNEELDERGGLLGDMSYGKPKGGG